MSAAYLLDSRSMTTNFCRCSSTADDPCMEQGEPSLDLLDRLMSGSGHTHLVLAGNPRLTARIRDRLPDRLRAKLVDIVPAPAGSDHGDVVQAALASFIEQAQQESFDAADTLCRES